MVIELDQHKSPCTLVLAIQSGLEPKINYFKIKESSQPACSGHVAKISMLRLNIGSGKLSSCMLSIGLGPKCEQGKGGQPPPLP